MTIETPINLGDRVLIKEVQRPGKVDIVQVDSVGTTYRVAYWDNGDRKVAWLYAEELEAR